MYFVPRNALLMLLVLLNLIGEQKAAKKYINIKIIGVYNTVKKNDGHSIHLLL